MDFTACCNPSLRARNGWWERVTKLLVVMKLTGIIILTAALHVSAAGWGQTVTYSAKDVPLTKVLSAIEQQTGLNVFYDETDLMGTKPVTVDFKSTPFIQALQQLLPQQGLKFQIEGNTISISRALAFQPITQNSPPLGDIHGRVLDDAGSPLAGASVTIKGTKKGTTTDAKGIFELKNVDQNATIIISYSGFEAREFRLSEKSELKPGGLSIMLKRATSNLDQVQIIAYGTTTQRFNTGDVTTVNSADIDKQPVNNPLLALEGRVPGLFITQATGFSGSGITIQIQGQNSISKGTDPFYVIDGVPYTSQLLPGLSGILGYSGFTSVSAYGNPMSYINPSDIESISILRDAEATAIYGSRAANGAILITTKGGKMGRSQIDINIQNGWGSVTRKLKVMNTPEYLSMRHEALNNDGLTPGAYDNDLNGNWDTTRNTNWQNALTGSTTQYTNISGSASGGNANTQYLIGATFHRETTVLPANFADQKGALHFNITNVSNNQRFHIQLTGNYLIDNNKLPNSDLTSTAIQLAPVAPPLYNKDGSLNWAINGQGFATWQNPMTFTYNSYQNKGNNLIANAILGYQIMPGFELKTSFGYTNLQTNETVVFPLTFYSPEAQPYVQRQASYGNNNINSWIVEPMATYKATIANGRVDALLGSTINQSNSNGLQLNGSGYNSDQVLGNIESAANISVNSATNAVYKYNAIFTRLNYIWADRYIVNLSARRDGSSRFGSANEFRNFEAASLGWVLSKEKFFEGALNSISLAKLRASYGTTGNDQIGDYQFMNLYYSSNPQVPYQGINGLQTYSLTNPYLQWEETKKAEVGLDMGILKDIVLIDATYYHNRSSNQLLYYSLPVITGFQSVLRNLPATVQNSGWEFTINSVNIKSRNFSWSTHFNLTIPQNKIVAFPNLSTSSYANQFVIGQPISVVRTFHYLGVNPSTGIYQFSDGKGGVTTTPDTSSNFMQARPSLINTLPSFYGGLLNSIGYKGFQLDFLLQFVKQIGPNAFFGLVDPGTFNGGFGNQPVQVLNRWQVAGNNASHQRYNSNYNLSESYGDAVASDAGFSDASYIRLKNLSLSWQMPADWKNKMRLQGLRIYLQGQNLLTITHYVGLDPETKSTTSLPPLKIFVLGVRMTI